MATNKFNDPRGGHARLYWEIIDSPAWRSLTPSDQRAYVAILRQLRSTNNGDLSLPLSLVKHHGIKSSATLAKSLRALIAVGLVSVTREGGCTKGGQRLPTLYRLTDYPCFELPKKNVPAYKATNEWKAVTNIGMGLNLVSAAEVLARTNATKKKAEKLKNPLQKLNATSSKNEAVAPKTASETEVWPPNHASKNEHGETASDAREPNAGAASANLEHVPNLKNHTSKSEVLSIVAIPSAGQQATKPTKRMAPTPATSGTLH